MTSLRGEIMYKMCTKQIDRGYELKDRLTRAYKLNNLSWDNYDRLWEKVDRVMKNFVNFDDHHDLNNWLLAINSVKRAYEEVELRLKNLLSYLHISF